jgi:CBS-domain-containing membrane protein
VKALALYMASCLGIIAVVGMVSWAVTEPHQHQTIALSAGLAAVVQLFAFSIARLAQPKNMMVGWGLGSVLRLVALVLYGLVIAKLDRAALAPALLSLVGFLFLTTVVEPLFLNR